MTETTERKTAEKEPVLVFNNREYPIRSLSREVLGQVQQLRFTEQEIQRLRLQLASLQTAANAYRRGIASALEAEEKKKEAGQPAH